MLCCGKSRAVADFAVTVEHVGSTSVPGLAAKPIIDLGVVAPTRKDVTLAIERLARLGYVHRGDLGVDGREAFGHAPDLPAHHLYVYTQGNLALRNHIALRDFLRTHPESVREYGALKKNLAAQHPNDIDAYVAGKTDVILSILRESDLTPSELNAIEAMNREQ